MRVKPLPPYQAPSFKPYHVAKCHESGEPALVTCRPIFPLGLNGDPEVDAGHEQGRE